MRSDDIRLWVSSAPYEDLVGTLLFFLAGCLAVVAGFVYPPDRLAGAPLMLVAYALCGASAVASVVVKARRDWIEFRDEEGFSPPAKALREPLGAAIGVALFAVVVGGLAALVLALVAHGVSTLV
jgi:hypothetical protein